MKNVIIRRLITLLVFSFCSVPLLEAQINELWRTGLTNSEAWRYQWQLTSPLTNHYMTTATVDRNGSTIAGGVAWQYTTNIFDPPEVTAFVVKFDRNGNKEWEHCTPTFRTYGVDSLAVDKHGDIYFTVRPASNDWTGPVVIQKISSNGETLWSRTESEVAYYPVSFFYPIPTSMMQLDSLGNAVVLTHTWQWSDFGAKSKLVLSKYGPKGRRLWQTRLPVDQFTLENNLSFWKNMALCPDGSTVVVGSDSGAGFVAKVNSKGRTLWYTPDPAVYSYANVMITLLDRSHVWDYDEGRGECRVMPERGVLLVVTDERGCETIFGFFWFPNALVDANGRELVIVPHADKWFFRDFVDTPDRRYRQIVKLFAEAGYLESEQDEYGQR